MRRRTLIALVSAGAMVLGGTAVFADDSYMTTPHAKSGPHFHKLMVVRNDLKGGGGKMAPQAPGGPIKEIPVADMSSAVGKSINRVPGNSVHVGVSTPEETLENRLRSLALELR